jgi:hypothetical protein
VRPGQGADRASAVTAKVLTVSCSVVSVLDPARCRSRRSRDRTQAVVTLSPSTQLSVRL